MPLVLELLHQQNHPLQFFFRFVNPPTQNVSFLTGFWELVLFLFELSFSRFPALYLQFR